MCENDFKDVVGSKFNRSHVECHEVVTVFGYLFAVRASQAERHTDAGSEENDQDGQPTA